MIISLVCVKRKDSYPGENALEVVDAADEYTMEGNPEALDKGLALYEGDADIEHVGVINIKVDGDELLKVLTRSQVIPAKVCEHQPREESATEGLVT